jgi:serine/threonine protein phosphatase PrpC
MRAYGVSDKGRNRPTNEDCFGIDESRRLIVVADGMGGHNAGEVAARMAVDAVTGWVQGGDAPTPEPPDDRWPFGKDADLSETGNLLRTAVQLANLQILEAAGSALELSGMGTTLVAAVLGNDRLSVAHVGDSRLYVFAGGRLRQLTRDDSWLSSVLSHDPAADVSSLRRHPLRNALTNVVGARGATFVHVTEEPLLGGEWVLMTTDGVHGTLDHRHLEHLLATAADPRDCPSRLVEAALAAGSRDNCTAVLGCL